MLNLPQVHTDADLASALRALLDAPALARLQRLDALASDPRVRQYEAIREKQGPRSGSEEANAQGLLARQRGVAVEILAARALEALARHLDQASPSESRHGDASPGYRVVTSLRVPSALAANADRAKTEWDAVLLRRADGNASETPLWDVCLLIEAKASVDAATTDLPRLLRGLRLLAQAEPDASYSCATQQGQVRLRGASLRAAAGNGESGRRRAVLLRRARRNLDAGAQRRQPHAAAVRAAQPGLRRPAGRRRAMTRACSSRCGRTCGRTRAGKPC
ncbi:hypothetical protein WJ968_08860 [Achromobacter xylosoxidans]